MKFLLSGFPGRAAPTVLLTLLLTFSVNADECGGSPCIVVVPCAVAGPSGSHWSVATQTVDAQQAANLVFPGAAQPPAPHLLSCPGTSTSTGGSGTCHLWDDGTTFTLSRNDIVAIHGDLATSFEVHSWPATKSVPVGQGLVNPGMCLVAGTSGSSGFPGVQMDKTGAGCLKFKVVAGIITVITGTAFDRQRMVTQGDADRVLTVTSQDPKKWHTLQHASRSFSHGVGCHSLLLRWLWGLIH